MRIVRLGVCVSISCIVYMFVCKAYNESAVCVIQVLFPFFTLLNHLSLIWFSDKQKKITKSTTTAAASTKNQHCMFTHAHFYICMYWIAFHWLLSVCSVEVCFCVNVNLNSEWEHDVLHTHTLSLYIYTQSMFDRLHWRRFVESKCKYFPFFVDLIKKKSSAMFYELYLTHTHTHTYLYTTVTSHVY